MTSVFSRVDHPRPARRAVLVLMTAAAVVTAGTIGAGSAPAQTVPDPQPTATPVASETPAPTATPTPTPTPKPTASPSPTPAPSLAGAATTASITWSPPAQITEETKASLALAGTVNGQATAHIALIKDATSCPSSPLYPTQVAAGSRVTVTPVTGSTTPGATGSVSQTLSITPRESGSYALCGWLVGAPASSDASTVARFSQVVSVLNRPAAINAEIPATVRSGDYFSVKLTGTTPASGRRVLVMAEKDTSRSCPALRKAPSGKLALQVVVGLPTGDFTKTLRLRFRSKSAGPYLLCLQIVEAGDRLPEAIAERTVDVSEGLKCVSTQTALTQRTSDLALIRKRRDSAFTRLNAAKKKLAPVKARYARTKKASDRRVAAARRAAARARSAAGRRKARARLARVRRTESRRLYRAGAPLRKANASVRLNERTYKQYRTGAQLLDETITRTKKDLKKYCA